MKNTKRLSLVFDEALLDGTRDFAKEMAYKIIDKSDVSIYDEPGNMFSKIMAFTGLAAFHNYNIDDSDSGPTGARQAKFG